MNGDLDAYHDPMVMLDEATTYLARVNHVIAEADRFEEILQIRDAGELYRQFARQRQYGIDIQNIGAEIKLRAERRAGELLRSMHKNTGQLVRGDTMSPRDDTPTYIDLGVHKKQASRWQQASLLPEDLFEQYLIETQARKKELTSAAKLALVKGLHQEAGDATIIDVTPQPISPTTSFDSLSCIP